MVVCTDTSWLSGYALVGAIMLGGLVVALDKRLRFRESHSIHELVAPILGGRCQQLSFAVLTHGTATLDGAEQSGSTGYMARNRRLLAAASPMLTGYPPPQASSAHLEAMRSSSR